MPSNRLPLLFIPSFVMFIFLSSLLDGDFGQLFHLIHDAFFSSDMFAKVILGVFILAMLVTTGITYIMYLIFRRKDKKEHRTEASLQEVMVLSKISYYYLYAFVGLAAVWLLRYSSYNLVLDYLSLLVPISLMSMLYHSLQDQKRLLLSALIMAGVDFIFYISFNSFSLEEILLYVDAQFLKVDVFLLIEFLPLFLLLLFFSMQASTSSYKLLYRLLMAPLIIGIFTPLYNDLYMYVNFFYLAVFEIFMLVAFVETRSRMRPVTVVVGVKPVDNQDEKRDENA